MANDRQGTAKRLQGQRKSSPEQSGTDSRAGVAGVVEFRVVAWGSCRFEVLRPGLVASPGGVSDRRDGPEVGSGKRPRSLATRRYCSYLPGLCISSYHWARRSTSWSARNARATAQAAEATGYPKAANTAEASWEAEAATQIAKTTEAAAETARIAQAAEARAEAAYTTEAARITQVAEATAEAPKTTQATAEASRVTQATVEAAVASREAEPAITATCSTKATSEAAAYTARERSGSAIGETDYRKWCRGQGVAWVHGRARELRYSGRWRHIGSEAR